MYSGLTGASGASDGPTRTSRARFTRASVRFGAALITHQWGVDVEVGKPTVFRQRQVLSFRGQNALDVFSGFVIRDALLAVQAVQLLNRLLVQR